MAVERAIVVDSPEITEASSVATVVNLRTERERAKRLKAAQEAAANRLAHGQSKAGQNLERARRDKEHGSLDQHRIDTGDGQ
ncbi:MAG: DUF4169 family protein [Xanthobacteraceae bacterium]